ncbi:hypothetical protein [Rhizobium mongolense]|uniref:Uncharacterized protein n=1 Tax=Rhizobium mongolense USDA 1844 TaxID=1079460 RepID=A0A559TJQ8_9HYPH|nr:hypothetical protein [Rhizobium mongolense]TVZ74858.1 hypothetical protein BCL32_0184 [Rhizobium mongolense USDA 1844]
MNSLAEQAVATTRSMPAKLPASWHVAKPVTVNPPPHVGRQKSHDAATRDNKALARPAA